MEGRAWDVLETEENKEFPGFGNPLLEIRKMVGTGGFEPPTSTVSR